MKTVNSINILEDGKLVAELSDNSLYYLQPAIVVNTYLNNEKIRIEGLPSEFLDVDISIDEIDGVAFAGDFGALDTAIRELAKKSNTLFFGGGTGGVIPNPLPISATSLPLPTGASTAANQALQITQETAINTNLALLAKLTDTQPVSATSLPLPTGASTSALQTTGNTSLSSIDTKLTSTNTKLDTLISNDANNARGTTATNTSVTAVAALSSGTQALLAAAAVTARKGVILTNNTNRIIYILFGAGTANTTTSLSVIMPSGSLYEVSNMFANVAIQFSISQATATGTILVTTVN